MTPLDRFIESTQAEVCEACDIDRSVLWRPSDTHLDTLIPTHVHQRIAGSPLVPATEVRAFSPTLLALLRDGETLVIPGRTELSRGAARARAFLEPFGALATVMQPLTAAGKLMGVLAFDMLDRERDWPDALVERLRIVARVCADALLRDGPDITAPAGEQSSGVASGEGTALRLEAALDVATLGSFERRELFGPYVLDDRLRDMFGVPPGAEDRAKEFWLAHIHPEDVNAVIDQGKRMEAGESRGSAEYRYLRPDGTVRWFSHIAFVLERDASQRAMREVGVVQDITERKRREEELRSALEEVRSLRDQLQGENVVLRHEVSKHRGSVRVEGGSAAIRRAVDLAQQVAPTPSTVLLLGETGTGKERFAEFIHEVSPRRAHAMVRVNCAAIPASLLESELFGREKGAYTGALSSQVGRFELANRSTLFLDEIGDLPADAQVKLLRVLEERQFERLGSSRPVTVDVRIVAASNRDLEQEVAAGRFRSDLYYRLAVFPITLPPLRERLDDLPILVEAMVDELAAGMGKRIEAVSQRSIDGLARYHWPGNIRELRNTVERALILCNGPVLSIESPEPSALAATDAERLPRSANLDDAMREHVLRVLRDTGWRIRGHGGAAEILDINPSTLETRMARLGIRRPGKQEP